jgi:hypothetical protein
MLELYEGETEEQGHWLVEKLIKAIKVLWTTDMSSEYPVPQEPERVNAQANPEGPGCEGGGYQLLIV